MAVMVTLTGKFVNPDESAALIGTRITFALVPADIPDQVLNETVVPGPVSVPIQSSGAFTVSLRATDDPDLLANVDGPLLYKVTRQGLPGTFLLALPLPGPWDWTDLIPQPANDTIVVAGPPGPPGPPGSGSSLVEDPPGSGLYYLIGGETVNAQTGTAYTLGVGDEGKLVTLSNASAVTVTVPPNSAAPFPTGSRIDVAQVGPGQVTVAQGAGVTVNATPSRLLRARYSGATLFKTGPDLWLMLGDMT